MKNTLALRKGKVLEVVPLNVSKCGKHLAHRLETHTSEPLSSEYSCTRSTKGPLESMSMLRASKAKARAKCSSSVADGAFCGVDGDLDDNRLVQI